MVTEQKQSPPHWKAAGYACFTLKMSSHEELVTISPFDLPKITFHVSFQQIYLEHAVRSLQSVLCHPTEMLWICCITEQHPRACTMPSPFGPSSFNQPDCSTSLYCARGWWQHEARGAKAQVRLMFQYVKCLNLKHTSHVLGSGGSSHWSSMATEGRWMIERLSVIEIKCIGLKCVGLHFPWISESGCTTVLSPFAPGSFLFPFLFILHPSDIHAECVVQVEVRLVFKCVLILWKLRRINESN